MSPIMTLIELLLFVGSITWCNMQDAIVVQNVPTTIDGIEVFAHQEFPKAVAKGFQTTAKVVSQKLRKHTRNEFDLHSDYIPQAIKGMPTSPNQLAAFEKAFAKYGDAEGSVYVRGSNSPKRDMHFMLDHETGDDRTPHGEALAVPLAVRNFAYRTGRGKVKKAYKPATLLEQYNKDRKRRKRRPRKADKKNFPFLLTTNGKTFIAKRSSRGGKAQLLYVLRKQAKQKRRWNFRGTAVRGINNNLHKHLERNIRRMVR